MALVLGVLFLLFGWFGLVWFGLVFSKTLYLWLLLFCRKAFGYNLKHRKNPYLQEKPQTTLEVLPLGFLQLYISLLLIRAVRFSSHTESIPWFNTMVVILYMHDARIPLLRCHLSVNSVARFLNVSGEIVFVLVAVYVCSDWYQGYLKEF